MVERKKLTLQEIIELHRETTRRPDAFLELVILLGLIVLIILLVAGFATYSGPSFTPGPGQYWMR